MEKLVKFFDGDDLYTLELSGITVRKYYVPLKGLSTSKQLFSHILCLPINCDMTIDDIDKYIDILLKIKS